MTFISVCEYEKIYPASTHSDDPKAISDSAFDWLATLIDQRRRAEDPAFIEHHGYYLKLKNYVGLFETPCGTTIEVLPKTTETTCADERNKARKLLQKMLGVVYKLTHQQATHASLEKRSGSLLEALISHFLQQVTILVHRGIRSDYVRIQAEKTFIKGRLRIAQQIHQPLSKQHYFQIEYDCFLPNRPENRLIKTALQWVVRAAKAPDNQRLARELLLSFDNIPHSSRIKIDLKQWSTRRDMVYYRPVKPWVELILLRETPWFLAGKWQGISLLFPMEKLFESYVEIVLRRDLPTGYQLLGQQRFRSLVTHNEKPLFQLKPDLILYEQGRLIAVLDTKWKQLDWQADKYGLSQSDFYQLFAYGQKYLGGLGNLVLIYPKTDTTPDNLQPFYFDEQRQLVLWVATFCLETDALHVSAGAVGLDTISAKN